MYEYKFIRGKSFHKEVSIDEEGVLFAQNMIDNEPIISTCINNIIGSFSNSRLVITRNGIEITNKEEIVTLMNCKWKPIIAKIIITLLIQGICPIIMDMDNDGDYIPIVVTDKSYRIKTFFNNIKKKQDFKLYKKMHNNPIFNNNCEYSLMPPIRNINPYYYFNQPNSFEVDEDNSLEDIDSNAVFFNIKNPNKEIKDVFFLIHSNFEPDVNGKLRSSLNKLAAQVSFFDTVKQQYIINIKMHANYNVVLYRDKTKPENAVDEMEMNIPMMYQIYNADKLARKKDEIVQKLDPIDDLVTKKYSNNYDTIDPDSNKSNNNVYGKELKPSSFNNLIELNEGYKALELQGEKLYKSNMVEECYSRLVKTISDVLGVYIKPEATQTALINNATNNENSNIEDMLDKTRTFWSILIENGFTKLLSFVYQEILGNNVEDKIEVKFVHNKLSIENQIENLTQAFDNNIIDFEYFKKRVHQTMGTTEEEFKQMNFSNEGMQKISKTNMELINLYINLGEKEILTKEETRKIIKKLIGFEKFIFQESKNENEKENIETKKTIKED